MGSCISKCNPNRKKKHQIDKERDVVNVQEKLVIYGSSENPSLNSPTQKPQNPNFLIPPFPPSPSHSSSSSASFSCSTSLPTSSPSSSSSSEQFLKQNPKIALLGSTKLCSQPPQKRQKSLRHDPVGPTFSIPAKKPSPLRSPSPIRRSASNGGAMNSSRVENFKGNPSFHKCNNNTVNNVKKGNLKCLSDPNTRSRRSIRSPSMRKEGEICRLSCLQDVEMVPIEELNNPLIALDCFIFL